MIIFNKKNATIFFIKKTAKRKKSISTISLFFNLRTLKQNYIHLNEKLVFIDKNKISFLDKKTFNFDNFNKYLKIKNWYKIYPFFIFIHFFVDTILIYIKRKGGGNISQEESIFLALRKIIFDIAKNINILKNTKIYYNANEIPIISRNLSKNLFTTKNLKNKERKKFGLKKARKASQYHKR